MLALGCDASHETPKSMCDLPRSFAGWQNTPIRWQGILLDATPHGMMLVAADCQRRSIDIERWPEDQALAQVVQESWHEPGILRVDVSGRITGERGLAIFEVHRIDFEPMSEQERSEFWRSIGF